MPEHQDTPNGAAAQEPSVARAETETQELHKSFYIPREPEAELDRLTDPLDIRDMLRASRTGDADTLATVRALRFALKLHRVPLDGPARWALVALAHLGFDVEVYTAASRQEAIIWLRPVEPWMEGRWSLQDWRIAWRVAYRHRVIAPRRLAQAADTAVDTKEAS